MLNCPYPKPLVPSAAPHTPSSSPAPSWAPGPLGNVGGSSGENPGWGPVVGGWLLGNVTVTALAGRLSTLRPPGHHLPKPGAAAPLACSACPQPLLHRSVLAPGSRPFPFHQSAVVVTIPAVLFVWKSDMWGNGTLLSRKIEFLFNQIFSTITSLVQLR